MLESSRERQPRNRSPREGPSACAAGAESGTGAVGQCPSGQALPMRLVAIVNLGYNHCRVFWAWRCFYPFVSGFSVAASYLFLHFGLVVFQGFHLFF